MFPRWFYKALVFVMLFSLAVTTGIVFAVVVPSTVGMPTADVEKKDGGVLVVPFGENTANVKSGKIDLDNKISFVYIGKLAPEDVGGLPICYASSNGDPVWVEKRYKTDMPYDIVIERSAGVAFVYLILSTDVRDEPDAITAKFPIYLMDGRSYWISVLLADSSKDAPKKVFHMGEIHIDCRIRGLQS